MNTYILPLSDPNADLETVGGKGMSLARLSQAGLPVPNGFHITTQAYRDFIAANDLQTGIDAALQEVDPARPSTLEIVSRNIGRLFAEAPIPAELAGAIVSAYGNLPGSNPPVAVRSSATAEDLPAASFAGQQETYLNIAGAHQVLEAARKCWASLWTARAIGYRARQGIGAQGVALAVVVQLLVAAEAAGILFTANPLTGKRDEAVINAAWGLGEAVVGGTVMPDTITISKADRKILQRETAVKTVMTVRATSGTGEQPVPNTLQKVPALSDMQVLDLVQLGVQIEALYAMPMDIEWALADGKFAILQARPVTALAEAPIEWRLPNPKGVYMRSSVADLLPQPISPLFATLGISTLMEQVYPLGKRITKVRPILEKDYITSINNYAYGNVYFAPKTWWWILTGLIPSTAGLIFNSHRLWREMLHPEYQAFVASQQDLNPAQMSAGELWEATHRLLSAAAYYTCGLLFATMGASAGGEGLLTRAYDKLAKRDGDPDATALMMGWDNIAIRSEKSLYDLALWVKGDEQLARFVLDTPSAELAAQLSLPTSVPEGAGRWDEFAKRLQMHMASFGHVIFQLDFAEPLPLDHPELMLEVIKMYLRGEGSNPHTRQQASERLRIQTTETMLKRLKGLKLWIFRFALNWGQSMAEVREDALAEIGLAYPKIRSLLHELGDRLEAAGIIRHADDIFWMEKDEVSGCIARLSGGQRLEDLSRRVEERKAFHARLSQITPPPMIPMKERVMGIKIDSFLATSEEAQTGNILKGVATSSGKATAPACILRGAEDFDRMKPGDVLVAGTTTPAWTPLFAMAAAVVTDIGGPLSHGSIVAREYGIPAVMGTGIATRRIQNGQTITVDGNTGMVTLR